MYVPLITSLLNNWSPCGMNTFRAQSYWQKQWSTITGSWTIHVIVHVSHIPHVQISQSTQTYMYTIQVQAIRHSLDPLVCQTACWQLVLQYRTCSCTTIWWKIYYLGKKIENSYCISFAFNLEWMICTECTSCTYYDCILNNNIHTLLS